MKKLTMDELGRPSVEEFKSAEKSPIVIVLDNVRSLNNVGSAFRTSDAFAIEKLYLCGITGKPPHRDINKTALGAQDSVTWEHVPETLALVKKLQSEGYTVLAVEQADESTKLQDFEAEAGKKYALVYGNEVFGVEEEVVAQADGVLEIPQFGTKHSLNISVSMGITIWDVFKKVML
ncbi:TrmH family RNA methyltransferase [Persicobacter sp. CCB-QB2]|uniref:TrmH family RNA methyltransferase n=1 Tax=Persicobacter sp. CCB-QB2 TaxID=1561025 RepID=UPI0006A9BF99|nr:TrmH family RNA methyltransferase [Persicobacter sp. CCB-QB2]